MSEPKEIVLFSNTTLVRDEDGTLSVWVAGEKMHGVASVIINNGVASIGLPLTRVRFAERQPLQNVYETKNNVVPFQTKHEGNRGDIA